MTPGAIRLKETKIAWRGRTVINTESSDKHLLRPFAVFVADEPGVPVSLAAHYATEAAADHEHEILLRQLITSTMTKEKTLIR